MVEVLFELVDLPLGHFLNCCTTAWLPLCRKIFKAAQNIINSTPGDFLGSKMLQGERFAKIFNFLKKLIPDFLGPPASMNF